MKNEAIGIIGCGNMGGAIISMLAHSCGITKKNLFVYDVDKVKAVAFSKCATRVSSLKLLVEKSRIIIIGVKPQMLEVSLAGVDNELLRKKLIVSILAGITLKRLNAVCGNHVAIVRTMPNLALCQGEGMTCLCKNRHVSKKDIGIIDKIFSAGGETLVLNEKHFDLVTAISGSGPAYFFHLAECLVAEAFAGGLSRKQASLLASQTLIGSGAVLSGDDASPEEWRARVTSKGGTTEAALSVMMSSKYKKMIKRAVNKACARSHALSK